MKPQAIIFDLDGTLIDSAEDIGNAVNAALKKYNRPIHTVGAYRQMIGSGLKNLVEKALPPESGSAMVENTLLATLEHYETNYWEYTKTYGGIDQSLDFFSGAKVPMAILSNKLDRFTKLIAGSILKRWEFALVLGSREEVPKKPDPAAALEIAQAMSIDPKHFWFVGDSPIDIQTAYNAGMEPVGVSWGYRSVEELKESGAKIILESPTQLAELYREVPFGAKG